MTYRVTKPRRMYFFITLCTEKALIKGVYSKQRHIIRASHECHFIKFSVLNRRRGDNNWLKPLRRDKKRSVVVPVADFESDTYYLAKLVLLTLWPRVTPNMQTTSLVRPTQSGA